MVSHFSQAVQVAFVNVRIKAGNAALISECQQPVAAASSDVETGATSATPSWRCCGSIFQVMQRAGFLSSRLALVVDAINQQPKAFIVPT